MCLENVEYISTSIYFISNYIQITRYLSLFRIISSILGINFIFMGKKTIFGGELFFRFFDLTC